MNPRPYGFFLVLLCLSVVSFAAPVLAQQKEPCKYELEFTPPDEIQAGKSLQLNMELSQHNCKLDYAIFYYRNSLKNSYRTSFLKKGDDGAYSVRIKRKYIGKPALEYYIIAYDVTGGKTALLGSAKTPLSADVVDQLSRPVVAAAPVVAKPKAPAVEEPAGEMPSSQDEQPEAQTPTQPQAESEAVAQAQMPEESPASAETPPATEETSEEAEEKEGGFELLTAETEQRVESASRYEQDISRSPFSITVITEEDIRNYGSMGIADVLRTVAGLDFLEISPGDKQINMRGLNREGSNKILVLIDGRSVYLDFFGITFWEALPIPVEAIQRIEVIRGPASVVYGANAFSGVINIYTKRPEDIKGLLYGVQGGNTGTTTSAVVGDRDEQLGYRVSASYRRMYDYDTPGAVNFDSMKGTGYIDYLFSRDTNLSLELGASRDYSRAMFSLLGPVQPNAMQTYLKSDFSFKGLHVGFWWSHLDVDLSVNFPLSPYVDSHPIAERSSRIMLDTPEMPRISSHGDVFDLELSYGMNLYNWDRFTVGTELRFVRLEAPQLLDPEHERNIYSAFAYNSFTPVPADWFKFDAGIRWDMVDVKERRNPKDTTSSEVDDIHSFSPHGALLFIPDKNHVLRLSGGAAFRYAAFFEANMQADVGTITTTVPPIDVGGMEISLADPKSNALVFWGAPNLKPETIYSAEFGYKGRLAKRFELQLDTFYNRVQNLILFEGDIDQLYYGLNPLYTEETNPFNFNNDVNVDNVGGEFEFRVIMTDWLKGFVNYSYQRMWITNKSALRKDYASRKNRFYDTLGSVSALDGKVSIFTQEAIDSFKINPDDVALSQITTVHKENPEHKGNIGLNFFYEGLRSNIYGHFVSQTERQNFMTRLATSDFYSISSDFANLGYDGRAPIATYTKGPNGETSIYGLTKIPAYFILNFNIAYSFLDGRMELGFEAYDLLHIASLWQKAPNNGFTLKDNVYTTPDQKAQTSYESATGIGGGRYIQYPRQLLFGQTVGGETIPTRLFISIRGKI